MIRVFRVPGALTSLPERAPDLECPDTLSLRRALTTQILPPGEVAAVQRALEALGGREADIIVGAGGTIFRIVARREPTPSGAVARPAECLGPFARQRGVEILTVDTSHTIERFADLLTFLGYSARPIVVEQASALGLATAVRDEAAQLIVLGLGFEAMDDAAIMEACAPRGAVLLASKGFRAPRGIAGVIELPIASNRVAAAIDAALASTASCPR